MNDASRGAPGSVSGGSGAGCLKSLTSVVALVAMAPAVATLRWWRAWRRGAGIGVKRRVESGMAQPSLARLVMDVDTPSKAETQVRRELTDLVVRLAEQLHQADDAYHLVYREGRQLEPVVLPLGQRVQSLGERFALTIKRTALEGRTVLWLVLDRQVAVGEVLDPTCFDPEADSEIARLLASGVVRWLVVTAYRRRAPATLFRMALWVPEASITAVDGLCSRFEEALQRES